MTISSSGIPSYLDVNNRKDLIRVCHESGKLWRQMTNKQVLALANRDCIYGKGTLAKLKYVVLQSSPEKAQQAIEDSDMHEDRLHSTDASKSVRREVIAAVRDDRIGAFTIFQHNYERCFNWPNYAHV